MFIPFQELRKTCRNRIAMLEKQGHDIQGLYAQLDQVPDSYDAFLAFARSIIAVPMLTNFPYQEPNDLATIQALRPGSSHDTLPVVLSDMEIRDKIYGGVYGRMLGCILGKPLEMRMDLHEIRDYLVGANAWPLTDFVPSYSPSQKQPLRRDCMASTRGFVQYVQPDDDINYMVLGLKVLEEFGPTFKTQDIAYLWREHIPYGWNWGPEHTRYCLLTGLWWDPESVLPEGKVWDELLPLFNDGEELIGAMIRGDSFGLVNPGRPKNAAAMAWRDGRLTHAKTGLYAEMWVAATIAATFHTQDPIQAITLGIEQLPATSRYAECLREALAWSMEEADWLKVWQKIDEKWGYLGFNGTFNESATIINSLVHSIDAYGIIDFERAICTQVMQGWDCDSAGATTGCIAGALAGYHNLPQKWLTPIQDTFYTTVAGEKEKRISAFAALMYAMSRLIGETARLEEKRTMV